MSELKPAAWMWEYRGFAMVSALQGEVEALRADGTEVTPLYAIPEQVKAQWKAEAVQSILDECEHWSLMGTWGILVEDISEKLEWLYQCAQEACDGS